MIWASVGYPSERTGIWEYAAAYLCENRDALRQVVLTGSATSGSRAPWPDRIVEV